MKYEYSFRKMFLIIFGFALVFTASSAIAPGIELLQPRRDLLHRRWHSGRPSGGGALSVPTALTSGDESTLKEPVFCLDNG